MLNIGLVPIEPFHRISGYKTLDAQGEEAENISMPRNKGRKIPPPPRPPFFNSKQVGAMILAVASNIVSPLVPPVWGIFLGLIGFMLWLFGLSPVERWVKNRFTQRPFASGAVAVVVFLIISGPLAVSLREWSDSRVKPIQVVKTPTPNQVPAPPNANAHIAPPPHELPPECRYSVVCMEGGADNEAYGNTGRVVLKGEHGSHAYGNVLPLPGSTINNAPNGMILNGGKVNSPTINNGSSRPSKGQQ